MSKQLNIKALVLALGLLSVSGMAQAVFTSGMSQQQVAAEIGTQLKAGISLDIIAKEANAAGLNPAQVTETLIKSGQDAAAVAKAIITVNPAAAESVTALAVTLAPAGQAAQIAAAAVAAAPGQAAGITKAAIAAAPAQSKAITAAVLIVPGVNPATVLGATAAGRSSAPAPAAFSVPAASPAAAGGGGAASPA